MNHINYSLNGFKYVYVVANKDGIHAVYFDQLTAERHAIEINGKVHQRILNEDKY